MEVGNFRLLHVNLLFLHDTELEPEGTMPKAVCNVFLDNLTANCGESGCKVECSCCNECCEEWQSGREKVSE